MKKNFTLCLIVSILSLYSYNGFGQVNGVNTINPSGGNFTGNPAGVSGKNWTTFSSAVSTLITYGVSGPVTFNVSSATYTDQISLSAITGTSATNTIVFQSASGDSSTVTLTSASATSTFNYTVKLNGANYVTFKKMTISNTNTTYSRVIDISNGSSYIQILNNRIIGVATTSIIDQNAAVYSYGSSSNNIIRYNRILNGSFGIYDYGSNSSPNGKVIESNVLRDFNYCGIYVYYEGGIQVKTNDLLTNSVNVVYGIWFNQLYYGSTFQNNIINLPSSTANPTYGIYASNSYYSNIIIGNDIDLIGSGAKYGIYTNWLYYSSQIANNTIDISSSNNNQYGIYSYYSYYPYNNEAAKIIGNKVNLYGSTTSSSYGINTYYSNNGSSATGPRNLIANNFISQSNGSGQTYGLYSYYCQYTDVIFNSFNITGNNTSSAAVYFYAEPSYPSVFRNNIVVNTGGGYAMDIYNMAGISACDNNDYYYTGTYLGRLSGSTNYSNLTAWKNQFSANDLNSININPSYTSATDLHTTNLNLQCGIPFSSVTTDIDGQTRNTYTPFIGADESFSPMKYVSVTTVQNNTNVVIGGSTSNEIIGVKINMLGSSSPFNLKQINMNTTGTTSLSDIKNAKIFYSGSSVIFDTTVQFGSTIATPGATMTFTGTRVLAPGNNYFWLSYGISTGATLGNVVDAQCTQITIDSATTSLNKTPLVTDPTGSRQITTTMSGTYTIDPAGSGLRNFTSFANAINDMMFRRVSGPVTFLVAATSFSERLALTPIPGASSTNKITFIGSGVTNTTLTYSGTTQAQRATISLNGAKYITFRKMRIQNTSTTYNANAVFLCNQADYNVFDSCYLAVPLVTSYYYYVNVIQLAQNEAGSYSTQGNASYNQFKNCTMYGGFSGVYFYGNNTNSTNNEFTKNVFTQQYYAGIYTYYMYYLKLANNSVTNFYSNNSNSYGIYIYNNYYSSVTGNTIQTGMYGLYCQSENGNSTTYSEIYNNMISNFGYAPYHYGIMMQSGNYVKIYHNSVWIQGTSSGGDYPCLYMSSCYNCLVRNNILNSTGNFYPFYWNGSSSLTNNTIDYNSYYTNSSVLVRWNNVNYPDLTSWKAAVTGQNTASYFQNNPGFISYSNLHLSTTAVPLGGPFQSEVATDFDGQVRGPNYAVVGADEITLPNATDLDIVSIDAPVLTLVGNNTITATLSNKGYNSIPAGKIYLAYQINSGTMIKDSLILTTAWTPLSLKSFSFKTLWNVSSTGKYNVRVWINPTVKGDPDTTSARTSKDSFSVYKMTALSGNYYIDSSRTIPGSFQNFTAAVNALKSGIIGPVNFIVTKGTYIEQIKLNKIINSNQINTITFESQSGNPKDVILIYYSATSANNYTLKLEGCSYTSFKNISIATGGWGNYHHTIEITGSSNYNYFINNIISGVYAQTTSEDFTVIYSANNSEVSWNTFRGNQILYGSYGFRLYGPSSQPTAKGMVIDNNIIKDFYYMGIYMYYFESATITNNTITSDPLASNVYGIYVNNLDNNPISIVNGYPFNGPSTVSNNTITVTGTSTTYGIYAYFCYYGLQLLNNKIYVYGNSGSDRYGIYSYYLNNGNGMKMVKNRIYMLASGSGYNYGLRITYSYPSTTQHLVANNFIIQQNGSGNSYGLYHENGGNIMYYHNSINITAGNSTSYAGYFYASSNSSSYMGNENKNNVYAVTGSNGAFAIYVNSGTIATYNPFTTASACNNNDYYVSGSSMYLGLWGTTNCATLSAWKTASSMDVNSINANPNFISSTLLYPSNPVLKVNLTPFTQVPDDIDGTPRVTPITLGAANQVYQVDAGIKDILAPVSPGCAGVADIDVVLRNMGSTVIDSATINWKINGVLQSPYKFKGTLSMLKDTVLTIGSYNFPAGIYKVLAYTTKPNGVTDNFNDNDADSLLNIKIYNTPAPPTGFSDTVCEGTSAILRATCTTKHYTWYDTTGNILGRDSILITPKLLKTQPFYVTSGSTGSPQSITTNLTAGIVDNGFMFDIKARKSDLNVDSFDVLPNAVGWYTIRVYYKAGTYSGFQSNSSAWTFKDSIIVYSTSNTSLIHVPVSLKIPKDQTYGIYITSDDPLFGLQGKSGLNSYTDTLIQVSGGSSVYYPFDILSTVTSLFSGKVYYEGYSLCTSSKIPVMAYVDPTADISYTVNDSKQCLTGNNFDFTNTTTSVDPVINYSWKFGDSKYTYQVFDTNHIYAAAGAYSVKLFATTSKGCKDSLEKVMTVYGTPAINAGPDKYILCKDSTVIGTTGNPSYLYRWSPSSGLSDTTIANPFAKPIGDITYYLTVIDKATGCKSYDNMNVVISNAPHAVASKDTMMCEGNSAYLTASGGTAYLWNTGETTKSIIKSPLVTTSYVVTVSVAQGCSDKDTVIVTVNPRPKASFTIDDNTQCLTANKFKFTNTSTIKSGTGSYVWSFGDGGTSGVKDTISHSYLNYGTFISRIVAISNFGCIDSSKVTVTVYPMPKAIFTVNNSLQCFNGNLFQFTNNSSIPSGSYTNYWTFGDGVNSGLASPAHTYMMPNTFNAGLMLVSDNGCTDAAVDIMTVKPSPVTAFDINDSTQCFRYNKFTFTNKTTIASGSSTYKWNMGDGNTNTNSGQFNHQYANSGTFKVTLESTSNLGCQDSLAKTVYVYTAPSIELGPDQTVKPSASVTLDAGPGFEFYDWSNKATTQTIKVDSNGIGIGSKAFSVLATDFNGCTASDNIIITFSKSVGIEGGNSDKASILIYPNPSNGKVNIEFSQLENEDIAITILNPQGQVVYHQITVADRSNSSLQLDLKDISTGLYFIRFNYKNQSYTEKLILK